MSEDEAYRPKLFYVSGPKAGQEEPFPAPLRQHDHLHVNKRREKAAVKVQGIEEDPLKNAETHLYSPETPKSPAEAHVKPWDPWKGSRFAHIMSRER